MPFYDYLCENEACEHAFEAMHGVHDRLTTCPECGQESLYRPINVPVISVPKTLGSLADKNSAAMSNDEMQSFEKQQKERKDTLSKRLKPGQSIKPKATPSGDKPWHEQYRKKSNKQIQSMNPSEKKDYVDKG